MSVCFPSGSISTGPGSRIGYSGVCSRLGLQSNSSLGSYSYAYLFSPNITTTRVWRSFRHKPYADIFFVNNTFMDLAMPIFLD